ncbi:Cadmium, cobalt and zinc/H(+)-K(+) antiporter [Sphingomonas paucimobilis]|nr:Cadmium, cobalt and zinc/H(+)-K(+) antiporter [Sphingomonas paucimobilis]
MALLADGFHMATHVGALGIAAIAYSYAKRHVANPRYSWGTGKVGELAGFGSAMVLGLVSLFIAYESITRLAEPHPVIFGDAIMVAVLGLAINLISALMLSGGHHHGHHHHHGHGHDHDDHHGHDHQHDRHGGDTNMRAAYVHVLADALTSVMAILALVAGRYLGWVWLDPAVGLLGAVVIANWSIGLMRQASSVLLDAADPKLAREVRDRVEGPGDTRIHDFHIWRIGPTGACRRAGRRGCRNAAQQRHDPRPTGGHGGGGACHGRNPLTLRSAATIRSIGMRALQFLAGAILLGALGGGAMLLRRADTPGGRAGPEVAQTGGRHAFALNPPPTPIASPPPTPFVVRQILDLKKPLRHGDYVWNESAAPAGTGGDHGRPRGAGRLDLPRRL